MSGLGLIYRFKYRMWRPNILNLALALASTLALTLPLTPCPHFAPFYRREDERMACAAQSSKLWRPPLA